MSGDNAKRREVARTPQLEWQSELDAAMAAIDSRLTHPRRRATDHAADQQPGRPGLGHELTPEILDEIARRVAAEIRRNQPVSVSAPPQPVTPPAPRPDADKPPALGPGKMLLIRYRLPLLPWPFRLLQRRHRKKQHPLTTARVSP
jgi:hypothetical protein